MSGDLRLRELLRRAGAAGDAFRLIAASWLRPGAAPGERPHRKANNVM